MAHGYPCFLNWFDMKANRNKIDSQQCVPDDDSETSVHPVRHGPAEEYPDPADEYLDACFLAIMDDPKT